MRHIKGYLEMDNKSVGKIETTAAQVGDIDGLGLFNLMLSVYWHIKMA